MVAKGRSAKFRRDEAAKAELAYSRAQAWARGERVEAYQRPKPMGGVLGSISAGAGRPAKKSGQKGGNG